MRLIRILQAAVVVSAAAMPIASSAVAAPLLPVGVTAKPAHFIDVMWRGHGWHRGGWRHNRWHRHGWGPAIGGIAAGAVIGSAIASSRAQASQNDAYCFQRFKSYDPSSGTYLGYDGLRHPCP